MADEDENDSGDQHPSQTSPPTVPTAPRMIRIQVTKGRNLPADSNTTVSYSYPLKPRKQSEEQDETDENTLVGSSQPLEETAQGTENQYNLLSEHILPPIDGVLLKTLITEPFVLRVEGLSAPGKVAIPLKNLVWRPKPTLDDPDEDEFLPEFPGKHSNRCTYSFDV